MAGNLAKGDGDVRSGLDFMGGIRLGARRGFFGEFQYNDNEPAPEPNTRYILSLGHTFTEKGTNVRVGAYSGGVFVGGRFVSSGGFEVEPFLGFFSDDEQHLGVMVRQRVGGNAGE